VSEVDVVTKEWRRPVTQYDEAVHARSEACLHASSCIAPARLQA
jgi:hypothetical protein